MFASANMEHPQALATGGRSGPVVLFARNRLCALVRPGLAVDSATLLDRMLDPQVRLGTSTPRADPSGDYAWEVFRKADTAEARSLLAVGEEGAAAHRRPVEPRAARGRTVYGALIADGKADIFLTYCTNALLAQRENAGSADRGAARYACRRRRLRPDRHVRCVADAYRFALFILSAEGQRALAKYGFAAPALPQ